MATLATGLVGAAIGFAIGGPVGAQIGWMAGVVIGGALFQKSESQTVEGPRLEDRSVQVSTYGIAIARIYGTIRVTGNVIWATELKETRHEETTSQGGKGGGGGQSVTQITYTYSSSFAVSLCEGEVTGIRRIWADGKLIYDVSGTGDGATRRFDGGYVEYKGSETQMPDPTIVAHMGNAPAYRGQAYVVFTDLQLASFGNRIPNLSFEISNGVQSSGTRYVVQDVPYGYQTGKMAIDANSGRIWSSDGDFLTCTDPYSKQIIAEHDDETTFTSGFQALCYMSSRNQIWVWWDEVVSEPEIWIYDCASAQRISRVNCAGIGHYKTNIIDNPERDCALVCGSYHPFLSPECYEVNENGTIGGVPGSPVPVFSWQMGLRVIAAPTLGKFLFMGFNGDVTCRAMSDYSSIWTRIFSDTNFYNDIQKYTIDSVRGRCLILDGNDVLWLLDMSNGTTISTKDMASYSPQSVHYYSETDTVYISSESLGGPWHVYWMSPVDLSILDESTYTTDVPVSILFFYDNPVFFDRLYFQFENVIGYWPVRKFVSQGTYPLSEALLDESALVGIPAEMVDVSEINEEILGYAISRSVPVRTVIEQLMVVHRFDAVDSSGKMKFVPRLNAPLITLDSDYLAAHEMGSDTPELMPITRRDETELPMVVITKYLDRDADYEVGAQAAARMTGFSLNEFTYDLPMVLTADQAKKVAEVGLYSAWATRTTSQVSTTVKYQKVEPTDLVAIDGNTMRVLGKELTGNRVTLKGEWENNVVYTQEATVPETEFVPQTIPYLSGTQVAFLDIVALRDSDSNSGFYIAANGYGEGWPGCVIYKSTDLGVSWIQMAVITEPTIMGIILDPLPAASDATSHYTTAFRVSVGDSTLDTITEAALLNGANVFCVGDEVIQYRVASEISAGIYLLTGILRGRRGSPVVSHAVGSRFVGLSSFSTQRIAMDSAEIGLQRIYRAVTIGRPLSTGVNYRFTNTGNALECLSPVQVGKGIDGSGNIQIHWTRRARLGGAWVDYSDAPLAEESESYAVSVYNGATLIRTITSTTQTCTYSVTDQTTDFGSPQTTLTVKVWQVSATNGAGFLFEGTI